MFFPPLVLCVYLAFLFFDYCHYSHSSQQNRYILARADGKQEERSYIISVDIHIFLVASLFFFSHLVKCVFGGESTRECDWKMEI